VIVTMTVPLDLLAEVTTVDRFIPMLSVLVIVATISQVLEPAMTIVIAHHRDNAQQDKEIVTKTVTVPLDSSVEKTTVNSFIPTLKGLVIVATMGLGQLYHCIVTTIVGSLTTFTQRVGVSWGAGEVVGNMREFSVKYIKVK